MRRLRVAAATLVSATLTFGAFMPSDQGKATPSACVWVGVGVLGNPTTTTYVDTDDATCPDLPPSDTSLCPDGVDDYVSPTTPSTVLETPVYVCIKNLP